MALGRSFEEVLQKGLRMLQIGLHGFVANEKVSFDFAPTHGKNAISRDDEEHKKALEQAIKVPTPKRIVAIAAALQMGMTTQRINELSGIDEWFLMKLKNIIEMEKTLEKTSLTKISHDVLLQAKKYGFSDKQISTLTKSKESDVRALRKKTKVLPVMKQIDTLAAEFPANTNYLYATYHGTKNDTGTINSKNPKDKNKKKQPKKVVVLGGGAYAIGTSVEFDWCSVTAVQTLKKMGYETIMVNYNPETVSTDYDMCDKLYFDELSLERILDIVEAEKPIGVVISTGGQVANNLAMKLHNAGVKILGTTPENIDMAEDRHKFSALLDTLEIDQPQWKELKSLESIETFAEKVGYPLLVRPSYVLSGAAMSVARNKEELEDYLTKATNISTDGGDGKTASSVVVSKFEVGAKEIEIDAVAHKGEIVIYAISEHIENAGVHSGDATIVLPPQKLYFETIKRIKNISKAIAKNLNISGPFNMQFLAKNNDVKVIECNLRASRSFPFASKVTGYNFIEIATYSMMNNPHIEELKKVKYVTLDLEHVGVKAPQFSFSRLKGADPVLGVEMASTGEVACFGDDMYEALLKAMISTGFVIPKKNILLSIGRIEDKVAFLPAAQQLVEQGFNLFATEGTSQFLAENGLTSTTLYKARDKKTPNILDAISGKKVDLVIDIPKSYSHDEVTDGYLIRRRAIDSNIPLITNVQVAKAITEALRRYTQDTLQIKPWSGY